MGAQTADRLEQFMKRYREWDDPSGLKFLLNFFWQNVIFKLFRTEMNEMNDVFDVF